MGQFRLRLEERLYKPEELEIGWRVRLVEHVIPEVLGAEGVVVHLDGSYVRLDNHDDFQHSSQRWMRLA